MDDFSSETPDPIEYHRQVSSASYKRIAYWFLRPLLSRNACPHLSAEYLRQIPSLSWVLPERGFPLETRRAWLNRYCPVAGKSVLVQGTGSGWDTLSWGKYKPAFIIGQDLYPFAKAWQKVKEYQRSRNSIVPHFLLCRMEQNPLKTESVDLIVSDAVFEHCKNLDEILIESFRILKPGGYVYATYGPLWFCFGGDHYSGRGGPIHGYSHIELSQTEYSEYFSLHKLPNEDAQSGGRYVELDLFSKLTTREYLASYARAGFQVADLILEISRPAREFRDRWPDRYQRILHAHPQVVPEDLLIKSNLVILQKPGAGR